VFEDMSPVEYVERRRAGELWLLLDVREAWELGIASVSEAVSIPMHELAGRVGELDASRPVAVLCHSGVRSAIVAGYLARSGFDRVANIKGGIDAWSLAVDPAIPRY